MASRTPGSRIAISTMAASAAVTTQSTGPRTIARSASRRGPGHTASVRAITNALATWTRNHVHRACCDRVRIDRAARLLVLEPLEEPIGVGDARNRRLNLEEERYGFGPALAPREQRGAQGAESVKELRRERHEIQRLVRRRRVERGDEILDGRAVGSHRDGVRDVMGRVSQVAGLDGALRDRA